MGDKLITAEQVVEKLREVYTGNRFEFDFAVSQWISGDHNRGLRQEIVQLVAKEKRPATKCGMHAVADVLKSNFDQLKLFS